MRRGRERNIREPDSSSQYGGQKFRLVAEGPNKGLADPKELIEAGKLTPYIDKTYPLSKVPEAMRCLQGGRARGKIIITP